MRLFFLCLLLLPGLCFARSVYTPRDSGTEPPGGPRAPEALPSQGSFGRTPAGGMGYLDAYGNAIEDRVPEPKVRKRLPGGAFGHSEPDPYDRPLPDPAPHKGRPAWSFK